MITQLKASEKTSGGFVVADIETVPQTGEVIDIDLCWRQNVPGLFGDATEIQHKSFTDWATFWSFLVTRARIDKKFRRVYAHNGGGFDWVCLAEWFLTDGKDQYDSLSNVQAGSRMIVLIATIEKRFSIRLADSLPLLRGSLDEMASKFLGKRKIDLGGRLPHEVKAADPALYAEYCKQDTELLLEILETVLKTIREQVAPIKDLGFTIGSTSMTVFRTIGVEHPITCPWEPELKAFLRSGFTGGRVEVFKRGHFPAVNVYDINSLYPSVMRDNLFPTTDRGYWVGENAAIDPTRIGVYEIEFDQNPSTGFPVLMQKGRGIYKGSGVYFSPEIILLKEIDPQCPIKVIRGWVFLDSARVFGRFVDLLYTLRLMDKSGPLGEICKYLLNSNFGKWCQKSERSKLIVCKDISEICHHVRAEFANPKPVNESAHKQAREADNFLGMRPISCELGVWEVTDDVKCEHEHVGIGGAITSYARVALYRGIQRAGFANVVYCDTDSVHSTASLPNELIDRDRLGAFKHEFSGEGVYAGKKLYALRGAGSASERVEKIRAKGVSVQTRQGGKIRNPNGHLLTFDDLLSIVGGKSIECTFTQPPTHLEVFSGKKKAGIWTERKRRIRCT